MGAISNLLGVPADRTDLVIVFIIAFCVVLLTLLVTIIQGVRKRPSAKTWSLVFIISFFVLGIIFFMFRFGDTPSNAEIKEKESAESTISEQTVDENVSFDEIYHAYKENELRADDVYKNNRYMITAKVNGIETGGLFNLTGGATLTLETKVGSTTVFFTAEFEKEQEESLKTISVGDTITFSGECLSAGTWINCELILD